MDLPDMDEARDPDLLSKKLWAQVPKLIRKDVEQHVAAKLPADLLANLRDLHSRRLPISYDDAFFHFGGAWPCGTSAENSSLTASWKIMASVAIGTIAISGFSSRLLRRRSEPKCRSAGRNRDNSSSVSSSPNFSSLFVVNGAAEADDAALTTASAEMKWLKGLSLAATFEGEFSNVTDSYAGKGVVRYAW